MIVCPHCEKPLGPEHDAAACRRRLSRRVFFGLCVAPLAARLAGKSDQKSIIRHPSLSDGEPYANLLTVEVTFEKNNPALALLNILNSARIPNLDVESFLLSADYCEQQPALLLTEALAKPAAR